jgi:hypothetical protein
MGARITSSAADGVPAQSHLANEAAGNPAWLRGADLAAAGQSGRGSPLP